ncbi:MAG: TIGR00725 family protein [Promethearchaeota archaeon]
MPIQIGVIGGGKITEDIEVLAEEVGRLIAKQNGVLINGGLGGVMEYTAKGAKENNGLTIGILQSDNKSDANPYIDVVIPTHMGYSRNTIVVLASDVVIAISGSTGTLSEIAMAMNYKIPVIVLQGSSGVADMFSELHTSDEWQLPWSKDKIQIAATPEEAVNLAMKITKRKIE